MTLLEKLTPYLPYGLKLKIRGLIYDFQGMYKSLEELEGWVVDVDVFVSNLDDTDLKPILRPLSDLSKEEYVFLRDEFSINTWNAYEDGMCIIDVLDWRACQLLLKEHFDLFQMIESGEAIDVNTLKN